MIRKIIATTTAALLWLTIGTPAYAASISNFSSWTQVQDPPHANMSGSIDSATMITLSAIGPVPAATDIGYQSVNGDNVAGSSLGNYFSANQDFHIAIDFTLPSASASGFTAIGFGIGEDSSGTNSAGVLLGIQNGIPLAYSGAARINDVPQVQLLGTAVTNSGRFFIRYDSLSGDIIYGVSTTPGSATPGLSGTFSSLQHSWNNDDLVASFFLRSDSTILSSSLTSGTVSAVFSNFEVLAGSPVTMVPLPAAIWFFGFGLVALTGLARRR